MNKKSGFTLAEVLVTLMIIGVIAAMTVPSLMQTTGQQEYKAALKKSVSMLNQAVTLNYALDGVDASDADYSGASFVDLMKKRMNVMSEDSTNHAVYTADGIYYKAMGSATGTHATSTASGGCSNASEDTDEMNSLNNICAFVEVDVNGKKGPNRVTENTGKVYDIYTFAVYPQKVLPVSDVASTVLYMK